MCYLRDLRLIAYRQVVQEERQCAEMGSALNQTPGSIHHRAFYCRPQNNGNENNNQELIPRQIDAG